MNGFSLPCGTQCRDLGVTITSDLSSSQHINEIKDKAHKRANCILRCFASRDVKLLVRAFTINERPIVEYILVMLDFNYVVNCVSRLYNCWFRTPVIARSYRALVFLLDWLSYFSVKRINSFIRSLISWELTVAVSWVCCEWESCCSAAAPITADRVMATVRTTAVQRTALINIYQTHTHTSTQHIVNIKLVVYF